MKIPKKFLKPYDPKKTEKKIYSLWEKSGYFNPDKLKKSKKKFVVVFPPPNITGSLHIGHALNASIQDVLVRKKRMQGFQTLALPGTDHAGIATQNVVEKQLKKQGLTRFDIGKKEFIKKIWQWKKQYGHRILEQIRNLGVSCDWSRTSFTMDKSYSLAVLEAFKKYWEKGLIYLGERTVNWCPRCRTSLSDLELEYKEEKSFLWHIRYPLEDKKNRRKYLTVATTRPETLFGDTAIAVNPKDKRYKNFLGKNVFVPIINRKVPIIADRNVDQKFGTGALKVTPAHSHNDFEIAQRHNLEKIKIIDENGRICSPAPETYQGLKVKQAREKIIEELEKRKLIAKTEPYTHNVPVCYRCHTEIEPLLSEQWFIKMDELAKMAKKAVQSGKIKFYPRKWEKIYFDWLNNIKDWCISRQIWWGHRLPIWYCQEGRKKETFSLKNKFYFLSTKEPSKCPKNKKGKPTQVDGVLDTWFSSALWPFAVFGWPKRTKDLKAFYPTSVLTTARDIINLWVARMIFSGLFFLKKEPFKKVIIHPTILTKDGKRMSKSLGTGIDPMDLVDEFGADATRFGIIWQLTGNQDIRWQQEAVVAGKKFLNKIWNASRFVLWQKPENKKLFTIKIGSKQKLTSKDKRIAKEFEKTAKKTDKLLENFEFGFALREIYDFFWHKYCDVYLEEFKNYSEEQKKASYPVLLKILKDSLSLLHPFIPFITEEIYQHLPVKGKTKILLIEKWPI